MVVLKRFLKSVCNIEDIPCWIRFVAVLFSRKTYGSIKIMPTSM